MTKEEKQKAIDALKISVPIKALTQEEFNSYIQALNQVMDWLEQELCEDVVSRAEVRKIAKEMFLEVANMELDVKTISDCISYTSSKCREVLERKLQALPPVTPQEPRKRRETECIQAIFTEALEEGIRCAMCTNAMKSEKGCDGGCMVDTKMYNKVMTEINSRLLRKLPKEGHWIKEESPYGWDGHSYQCSECGRSIHLDTEMEDLEDYPYCHCGADMREVQEDDR